MWILRSVFYFWFTRFFLFQLFAISSCWLIFHLPMYCVYGSYASAVFFVNVCQWPSKEWLGIKVPTTVSKKLIDNSLENVKFGTIRDAVGFKPIEAVIVSNVRVDDTNDLADVVREQFFLKSVVYVMLVLAVAVATGFGSKPKSLVPTNKIASEENSSLGVVDSASSNNKSTESSEKMAFPMDYESKAKSVSIKEIDLIDWFKALVLFIILVMGLLWDVAICFYQRKLNEKCHTYFVLIPDEQH
jgi:hypothetical protein